jgi:4-hydroxybenzoate polyprenyltransferase/phosphoserine phosphatase
LMLAIQDQASALVVDLDGTLLRSDMLFETFWSSFSRDWSTPLAAAAALTSGRAALKARLARTAQVDVATLPYNPEVLAYIEAWRAHGGRTTLVTASDAAIANAIADHLGLFDEVHGSDGSTNLKGPAKAAFLAQLFPDGYVYMGDSKVDLPVWQAAQKAVTVNAAPAVKARVEALCVDVEHIEGGSRTLTPYLKALRPHQWLKNGLVFLPMILGHVFTMPTAVKSLTAFIAYSLVASSVYVVNDLLDLATDRVHPRKRMRPFASGNLPLAHGTWIAAFCFTAGTVAAAFTGWPFALVLAGYYFLTTSYSLYLKRLVVIDIFILAGLYTLRIIGGAVATQISPSIWLLAFSMFIFFSLAAVKRYAELVDNAVRCKLSTSGRGYHVNDLPVISMIALGSGFIAVLVMALYVNSPAVVLLYKHPAMLWGICCVLLYWVTHTVMVTHRGQMHDDPVVFAVKDRISQICGLLILLFALGGML